MAIVIILLLLCAALSAAAMTAIGLRRRDRRLFDTGCFWLSLLSVGLLAKPLAAAATRLDAEPAD